jgi:hypothetical protein
MVSFWGLHKNLVNYKDERLVEVGVNGTTYRTKEDSSPMAFLGLCFGDGDEYNLRIAEAIQGAREHFGRRPTYVDPVLGSVLSGQGIDDYVTFSKPEGYLNTREAILKLGMRGLQDVVGPILYIVHPAHAQRALWIGAKLGYNGYPFLEKEVVWPGNDPQWFVQGPWGWALREAGARFHHWKKKWI